MRGLVVVMVMSMPLPAAADGAAEFVEGNVLATLYHEIGHAVIDVLDLPVLGREEDAADSLASVMIHSMWEEEQARSVTLATALSFIAIAEGEDEPVFWGVHGTNNQRFYNTVCLFYGADPDNREDFATELGLPEERAATCPEEFVLADESWTGLLYDALQDEGAAPSKSFAFSQNDDPMAELLTTEVDDLNAWFNLPVTVTVLLEPCGEANAYYDPNRREITICTEYVDFLWEQARLLEL